MTDGELGASQGAGEQPSPGQLLRPKWLRQELAGAIIPTPESPSIHGVAVDWPTSSTVVTIVASASGDASVYTTGRFGMIGGIGVPEVNAAAKAAVATAQPLWVGTPDRFDITLPQPGTLRVHLLGYDGSTRSVDVSEADVDRPDSRFRSTWRALQQVLTEFRMHMERERRQQGS